ncbi:MAG: DUF4115 domain-containing protein [Gammaproteobacteria bacterium]|nr:DUF4115 domain-containing protein [Gammaproteobacteria bacterium]
MSKRNKKQRNPEQDALSLQAGDRLRIARESRDLSIDDVAARLKLDVRKIRALEQGDIADFPAPVFAAGYLRAYARLMELPEEEVLADFTELASVHDQVIDPASAVNNETYSKMTNEISSQFSLRDKSSGNHWGKAGLAGVVIVGLVYFLWPISERENTDVVGVMDTKTSAGLAGKTVGIAIPVPDVVTEKVVSDTPAVEAQNPAVRERTAETDPHAMVTPELSAEPVAVSEVESEAPDTDLNSELILIFNSDSWAEVQDVRGQRLMYRLGKAGTQRVVTGVAPFVVQLGYVQGVDILYNGAVYDLSKYANRRSVRLRIGAADEGMGGE